MAELKKTPLFPEFEHAGAKIVDFGGWAMPVQFAGIKKEHEATRTKAGLFDVSHMGEIFVQGANSEAFLQKMLTNDISKLTVNRAQYNMMCNEDGGTIDDLIVYKLEVNTFLLVVNAANTQKDLEWLEKHRLDGVYVMNKSSEYVQLAIQGPKAESILQSLTKTDLSQITFFRFEQSVWFDGFDSEAIVSRTGYTGEDGFEIYIDAQAGRSLWTNLLQAGREEGIEPVGLGARDTLRFEANLPLYGQELSASITPVEAGLSFAVKTKKDTDFIGKDVLKRQKEEGTNRKLVGIEMIDKGIPRHGYDVLTENKKIGFVTTGTQSPTLKKNIGLVLVNTDFSEVGTEVFVQVRNKKLKAQVVSIPFYKRS